jgi:predicted negative regulator of RcsB-dependent stress response
MDEYLSEKEQWEHVVSVIRMYAPWVIAGVAVAALGMGGMRWWQGRTEQRALDSGARYQQVLSAFARGDRDRGLALIDELQREHAGSPYVDQANLAAARVFVDANELDRAQERLRTVVREARDPELVSVARLRLARVQIALHKPSDALDTLATPLGKAFDASSHEVRGDAYYAKGDRQAALTEYRAARAAQGFAAQGPGLAQNDLLNLKINDLTQETGTPPTAARATAPVGAGK